MKRSLILSALALTLAACSVAPTEYANLGSGPLPLTGRITNYSPSNGATIAVFYKGTTSVATGPVDNNGNFSVTVPVPTSADYTPAGTVATCDNLGGTLISRDVVSTPVDANIALPRLSLTSYGLPRVTLTTDVTASSGSFTLYAYADRDADVTGTARCALGSGGQATYTVNMHFKQGWNLVSVDVSGASTNGSVTYRTVGAPVAGSSWVNGVNFGSLGVRGLFGQR